MTDVFNAADYTVGNEVLIHAPGDVNVVGVVAAIDEGARSVTFADGRVYSFPEEQEVEP